MKRLLQLAAVVAVSGCITEEPAGPDTTRPEVTVQLRATAGVRTFKSTDPVRDDLCAKVRAAPVEFTLTAGDTAGLAEATFRIFPGAIVPGSVTVPTAPDITFAIRSSGPRSQELVVTLRRPEPGRVRTGVIATFQARGDDTGLPFAITASATDYARNRAFLNQVDIRASDDPVICE